jgi:hypothetical protein
VVHSGPLEQGQVVGPIRAAGFVVYTSDGDDLWIANLSEGGDPFLMCGDGECSFPLP